METLKAITGRYSVRSYKKEQVPKDLIEQIIAAGLAAPVGMGLYKDFMITVIQDEEYLAKINKTGEKIMLKPGSSIFYHAPTLLLVSGKKEAFAMEQNSGACIAQNMLLAATDLGLGTVYIKMVEAVYKLNPSLKKPLNLPSGFKPIVGIALGYIADTTKGGPKEHTMRVDWL